MPSRKTEDVTEAEAAPADVWSADCPSRRVLELIANKWALLLIPLLRGKPQRNNELLRKVGGISQKMLTQTLRELERHGIVHRRDYGEVPPRVEYSLTPLGRSLAQLVRRIEDWVESNYSRMTRVVQSYDAGTSA